MIPRCQYCGRYVSDFEAAWGLKTVAAGDEVDEVEVYTCFHCEPIDDEIERLRAREAEPAHDDELAKLAFELAERIIQISGHTLGSLFGIARQILAIKAKREGGAG